MRTICAISLLWVALSTESALGAVVRVDFTGHIDYSGDPDGMADRLTQQQASLGWSAPDGTTFSGFFTFDDAVGATPILSPVAEESNYLFLTPDWTLETALGPLTTRPGPPPDHYFVTPPTGDGYTLTPYSGDFGSGLTLGGQIRGSSSVGVVLEPLFFQLDLQGAAPFNPAVLAQVPWTLGSYTNAQAVWTFDPYGGPTIEISGVLDSLAATRVPEPAISALFGLAIAVGLVHLFRPCAASSKT